MPKGEPFKIICGAKKKNGTPCMKAPMHDRKRCRLHGGVVRTVTKGNSTAAKPGGLYSKYLTTAERELFDNMELGTVDAELKLMRVRLERALEQEQKAPAAELEARVERDGGGPGTVPEERHYKVRDWRQLVQSLMRQIESLEKTRAELLKSGNDLGGDDPVPQKFVFEVIDGRK